MEFLEDELRVLDEFVREEQCLSSCAPIKQSLKIKLDISAVLGKQTQAKMSGVSIDDMAIILHRLRPFILGNERTFYPKICKLIKRRIKNDFIHQTVNNHRDVFLGKKSLGIVVHLDNGEVVNREKQFQVWLNADHYHRGMNEKETIEQIRGNFPGDFVDSLFWMMIVQKINAIKGMSNNIQALRSSEEL